MGGRGRPIAADAVFLNSVVTDPSMESDNWGGVHPTSRIYRGAREAAASIPMQQTTERQQQQLQLHDTPDMQPQEGVAQPTVLGRVVRGHCVVHVTVAGCGISY